jgi:hypothetical protein
VCQTSFPNANIHHPCSLHSPSTTSNLSCSKCSTVGEFPFLAPPQRNASYLPTYLPPNHHNIRNTSILCPDASIRKTRVTRAESQDTLSPWSRLVLSSPPGSPRTLAESNTAVSHVYEIRQGRIQDTPQRHLHTAEGRDSHNPSEKGESHPYFRLTFDTRCCATAVPQGLATLSHPDWNTMN